MKILIADDHHLILEGLQNAIERNRPEYQVDAAINKAELDGLLSANNYDLLLLDVKFGRDNAKTFIADLKEQYPLLKIVIISSSNDFLTVQFLKNAGVNGYVLKSDSLVEVLSAVRAVANGETYFSASLPEISSTSDEIVITPREREVLKLIMQEKSTKNIAEELNKSVKTIEMHRTNLFLKLGVKNIAGLVKKTILLGLLD